MTSEIARWELARKFGELREQEKTLQSYLRRRICYFAEIMQVSAMPYYVNYLLSIIWRRERDFLKPLFAID